MRRPQRTPSHAPIRIAAIVMVATLASCSKPAPTAPTPASTTSQTTAGSCTYGVESSSAAASVAAGGADLTVTVTTTAGCAWTSASTAPFVTATPASGTGSGQVHLAVTENLGDARTTTATIAGVAVPIAQASSCSFTVTPTTLTFEAAGGDATIAVSTRTGCSWKSATTDGYLHLGDTPPAGSGSVSLHVDANAGLGRTGTVTVAGQPVAVRQGGPPVTPGTPVTPVPPASSCPGNILTLSTALGAGSATVDIIFDTPGACAWTASTNDAFLSFRGETSITGGGTVHVLVAQNDGPARVGTVFVAGRAVTISQMAAGGPAPPPPSGTSFLTFVSDPGDIVGQGQSATFTLANSNWIEKVGDQYNPSVWVQVSPPPNPLLLPWSVAFMGPDHTWPTVGTYDRVDSLYVAATPGTAGLSFTGNARGCNHVTGRFVVLEASFTATGVNVFHATFEQHCEGAAPAVRGEVLILGNPPR